MQTSAAMNTAPVAAAPAVGDVINLTPLRDGLRELEIAARKARDVGEAYSDLLKDIAQKTKVAAPVIRSYIAARIAEDDKARSRKRRRAEQLSLLFDEIGT